MFWLRVLHFATDSEVRRLIGWFMDGCLHAGWSMSNLFDAEKLFMEIRSPLTFPASSATSPKFNSLSQQ